MTVICWDGRTLAADKQSTNCGVPGGLVGFTGNEGHAMALLAWFKAGRDPEKWPRKGGDESAGAIFATTDGLFVYSGEDGPNACRREDRFGAWGGGRDYALAALHLGHDARKAVEVACALDNCCGKGIDVLELEA